MTHILRYPWMDEDPKRLPLGTVLIERVALGNKGELLLQGRVVNADATRGAVRNIPARPDLIASLLVARALRTRRGMFYAIDIENPWREAADAVAGADPAIAADPEPDHGRREGAAPPSG